MRSEWRDVALLELGRVVTGRTPSKANPHHWGTKIPFLTPSDMDGRRIIEVTARYVSEEGRDALHRVVIPHGVGVSCIGWKMGKSVLINRPTVTNQQINTVITDPTKVERLFLYYALTARREEIFRLGAGGSRTPILKKSDFERLCVSMPPLPEQRRIAAVLGALDDKIELNRQMNQTLEEMAQAVFKSWFIDFDGHDPDDFVDSELGPIPRGWDWVKLEDATDLIIDHRGKTPKKMGGDWSQTGYPAVSAKHVKMGHWVRRDTIRFVDRDMYRRWMKDPLRKGDILLTSEAPLGEVLLLPDDRPYCLSQRLYAVRPGGCIVSPEFLFLWLKNGTAQADMRGRATGTTVRGIRQSELRKVRTLVPSEDTQLAASLRLGPMFGKIHANTEQNQTLADLRDTLLPKLISGEIRVPEAEEAVEAAL